MQVRYRSAIAFKLSPHLHRTPIEMARDIASIFNSGDDRRTDKRSFAIAVSDPGWLDFRPTDGTLACWLQDLLSAEFPTVPTSTVPSGRSAFFVQYTHARCCSWLRLAEREGLLSLEAKTLNITAPDPIPWSNDRTLIFQHAAERSLVAQLVAIFDALECSKSFNAFEFAERLSQRFETFERQCQIVGAVARNPPHPIQGRSGLVSATQKILNALLQQGLGLVSPYKL